MGQTVYSCAGQGKLSAANIPCPTAGMSAVPIRLQYSLKQAFNHMCTLIIHSEHVQYNYK